MRNYLTIYLLFLSICSFGQFSLLYNISTTPIPTNYLVYYQLNNNLSDASVYSNDASIVIGSANYTTDRNDEANQAFYFNGSTSFMSDAGVGSLTSFTYNCWAKSVDGSNSRALLNLFTDNSNYFFIARVSNEYRVYYVDDGVLSGLLFSGVYDDTDWHMVTLMYDRNVPILKLYLDNVLMDTYNDTIPGDLLSNPKVRAGSRYNGVYYYYGSVDDIRLYPDTLRYSERKALLNE